MFVKRQNKCSPVVASFCYVCMIFCTSHHCCFLRLAEICTSNHRGRQSTRKSLSPAHLNAYRSSVMKRPGDSITTDDVKRKCQYVTILLAIILRDSSQLLLSVCCRNIGYCWTNRNLLCVAQSALLERNQMSFYNSWVLDDLWPCPDTALCSRGGCQSAAGELFASHTVLLLGFAEVRNTKTWFHTDSFALLHTLYDEINHSLSVSRSKELDEVLTALLLYLSCFFEHKSLENKPKLLMV